MEYTPLEVIGHGSFGIIRKVRRRSDGVILARKEIAYKAMNHKERAQLIAEFRILKSLTHPNIVQYLHHEHVLDSQQVHLYMEFCGGGDLASLIQRFKAEGGWAPESLVWSVFTQVVLALYRCHFNADPPPVMSLFGDPDEGGTANPPQSFVLHRDIKPENIFLADYGLVKLGDFGLAKLLDNDNPLAHTYVGTPYYMSPEVLMDQPSTPASDIWSLGCVLYELCALHPPFQAKSHLHLSQKIREGTFAPLPAHYSQTLARTIAACLTIAPAHRPTAATLLRLDVVKLCRRDIELAARERRLDEREEELDRAYTVLERDLEHLIDEEVTRRVAEYTGSSPEPTSPKSSTPSSRQVRGPRNPMAMPPLARHLSRCA